MTNRLINETSPYLLQHAHNPVDWYPWGSEAFAKAVAEDKPVLVSIGYAACHWCHVMERESFEDEAIAAKMNDGFVCIKVDREERPDVDSIYMQAMMAMQGQGGWPLNVFLTPDALPFYGGTYFPNNDRGRMPSWPRVLDAIQDAYRNQKTMVEGNAERLAETLRSSVGPLGQSGSLSRSIGEPAFQVIAETAFQALGAAFDPANGGFGGAPKFPQTMPQEFLLRYHARTGDQRALEMVETSLSKMAAGGIYDHLGGGFARYSTDDRWLVPHFEKMLYDNALLAMVYLQGYQATGSARFRQVAEETLDYLIRDLRHARGGFFSSQDADSEGVEGKYYVWTAEDIGLLLGQEDGVRFAEAYGVDRGPNFEGQNILYRPNAEAADREEMAPLRAKLLAARALRVPPATDDKVLTSWNGLAIRALAEAGAALDQSRYRDAAVNAASLILAELRVDGRLMRTWKNGAARLLGYLEDYASLINALVSLHAATFDHAWLHSALELADGMVELFWDDDNGCFFDVGTDHEKLIVRPRDLYDNAIPSGSSAATDALLRLATISGEQRYAEIATRMLASVSPLLSRVPLGFGNWLKVAEHQLSQPSEVVIVGDPEAEDTKALLRILHGEFRPNVVLVGLSPYEQAPMISPLFESRSALRGEATAYVCRNYACKLPTTDPNIFRRLLEEA